MKVRELLETINEPFVVSILRKLLNKGERVYLFSITRRGEEAHRIISLDYVPASKNVGGEARLEVEKLDQDNEPVVQRLSLIHSPLPLGPDSFDDRWTFITLGSKRLMILKAMVADAVNLKDQIVYSDFQM